MDARSSHYCHSIMIPSTHAHAHAHAHTHTHTHTHTHAHTHTHTLASMALAKFGVPRKETKSGGFGWTGYQQDCDAIRPVFVGIPLCMLVGSYNALYLCFKLDHHPTSNPSSFKCHRLLQLAGKCQAIR